MTAKIIAFMKQMGVLAMVLVIVVAIGDD